MWRDDPRGLGPDRHERRRGAGDPRASRSDPRDVFARELNMPRERTRERVRVRHHSYDLRASEVRVLATVGAFRVVPASDLRDSEGRPLDARTGDLRHLRESGLVETRPYLVGRSHTRLVTLTRRGRDVLEDLRRGRDAERPQAFYDGLAKAREVAHDCMLYRAYLRSADRIVERGGRIHRVVLDHELKRDYQRFLQAHNRGRPRATGRPGRDEEEITRWAAEHGLPCRDGHVEFPDVRIEYVDRDEVSRHEDVEVETLHYRGAHAAGKAAAGFTRYHASGPRIGGSGHASRGSAPFDPRAAEDLL
jgi:hypothetical protein